MKFNRNLAMFSILLAVSCLMLVSQVSAADFNGTSLSDLDNSIKTSEDKYIDLTNDLNFSDVGTIELNNNIIDGNGHSIVISPNQNDVFMKISGESSLKNIVISGGTFDNNMDEKSFIFVNQNSKLILDNVTFSNFNINGVDRFLISTSGEVVVQNSTLKNIYSSYWGYLFKTNCGSALTFNDSVYVDSSAPFVIGDGGVITLENSKFSNVYIRSESASFLDIGEKLYVKSSLFENIYSVLGLISSNIETNGSIEDSVFLGFSWIVSEKVLFEFVIKNNYFGSNNPVSDGLIDYSDFNMDENLKLNIEFPDNDDINNLTVGKKIPVVFKLIGNTQSLPVFSVNLTSSSNTIEFSDETITFINGSASTYIIPRQKGEDSIVLGYDLNNEISPKFDFAAYGDLKNYSLTIKSLDTITYGDDLDVTVELKDANSNPISGNVALFVNGNSVGNVAVNDGVGSIALSKLNAPVVSLNAWYLHELPDYNDVNAEKSITINKKDLDLKFSDVQISEGNVATVSVRGIPDDFTSTFIISLSNDGGQVTPNNGVASQSFSNLGVGEYIVSIFTLGDNNYNSLDDFVMVYVTESSSTPDTPVNPDVPVDPDTPVNPDVPDAPVVPDTPVNPDVPDTPGTPGTPDVPDVPDTPGTPDVPDIPVVPDAPDVPVVPEVPSNTDPKNQDNSADSSNDNQNSNTNQETSRDVNSDNIQSNSDNAQTIDVTSGTSNNDVVSSENSASPNDGQSQSPTTGDGESQDVSKAYDISKVIDDVIQNQVTYEVFILIAVVLLLLVIGYRRKNKDEEY